MGAGLGGDEETFALGCGDEREGAGCREVHDVEAEGVALVAGFAREFEEHLDGF